MKNKTTNKASKAEPTKTKGKQRVEKTKQTAVKESAKPEKVMAKKHLRLKPK